MIGMIFIFSISLGLSFCSLAHVHREYRGGSIILIFMSLSSVEFFLFACGGSFVFVL